MTSAANLLYYVEPHPIRNTFTEHLNIVSVLSDALRNAAKSAEFNLRIFGSDDISDEVLLAHPLLAPYLQRPTRDETLKIRSFHERWSDKSIAKWIDLTRGEGELTEFYASILERLNEESPIDIILCWSENGAVRRFSERHGIKVIHAELGPTRLPYPETIYFDRSGTNGNAAFRKEIRAKLEEAEKSGTLHKLGVAAACLPLAETDDPKKAGQIPSMIDTPVTWNPDAIEYLPDDEYVFISLQLADDLNMIQHSRFKSPIEFLQAIIPIAKSNGYAVVVKGHPGAVDRPYNLSREIEALLYLETEHPDVVIVPRNANHRISNYLLGNASYSICINSSQGFEAMILGVPPIVLGEAAYDADGWLQEHIPFLPKGSSRDVSTIMDAVVGITLSECMVLRSQLGDPGKLKDIILSKFDDFKFNRPLEVSSVYALDLPRKVEEKHGSLLINAKTKSEIRLPLTTQIACHIDSISQGDGENYSVRGWAYDTRTSRPPSMIWMVANGMILSEHRVIASRRDVIASKEGTPMTEYVGFTIGLPKGIDHTQLKLLLLTYDRQAMMLDLV